MARPVCDNEDHPRPRPAVVRTSWPSGRFKPALLCRTCLRTHLWWYVIQSPDLVEGPYPVLIEPVGAGQEAQP